MKSLMQGLRQVLFWSGFILIPRATTMNTSSSASSTMYPSLTYLSPPQIFTQTQKSLSLHTTERWMACGKPMSEQITPLSWIHHILPSTTGKNTAPHKNIWYVPLLCVWYEDRRTWLSRLYPIRFRNLYNIKSGWWTLSWHKKTHFKHDKTER